MSDQEHANSICQHCRQLTAAIQKAQMAGLDVEVRVDQAEMTDFADPDRRWLTFVRAAVSRVLVEAEPGR